MTSYSNERYKHDLDRRFIMRENCYECDSIIENIRGTVGFQQYP